MEIVYSKDGVAVPGLDDRPGNRYLHTGPDRRGGARKRGVGVGSVINIENTAWLHEDALESKDAVIDATLQKVRSKRERWK